MSTRFPSSETVDMSITPSWRSQTKKNGRNSLSKKQTYRVGQKSKLLHFVHIFAKY